jgi:cytosine/adenosine deaminase-related metal-dependent hydrolase
VPLEVISSDQCQTRHADQFGMVQPRSLKLRGARLAIEARSAIAADVEIGQGRIQNIISRPSVSSRQLSHNHEVAEIDLTGYLLLPGLINAHDHLEFSLFPRLGHGPYRNAEEWARDIYHPESSPIREHLQVPKAVRLWWGAIKNLLCGVTTVCHHNEFYGDVFRDGFPVRVLKRYAWSHSLHFGGDVAAAFRTSDSKTPFIIHLAEGTDAASATEVFELDRLGLLDERTVIVHGVALDDTGHDLVAGRGSALIWCPGSNLFTLGATLSYRTIERNPRTALGSDSVLTAGDLIDQIRIASELGISAERIFDLVTTSAADTLKLENGEGRLRPGSMADLIAVPDTGLSPAAALVQATMGRIELVLSAGEPRLLSNHTISLFPEEVRAGMETIVVDGLQRCIRAPVPYLLQQARKWLGDVVTLAGKDVRT